LRAVTLWVAVMPVLTIPFLLGGVSWLEVAWSLTIHACAICWALAAGMLASAWCKRWVRAVLRAFILAILFLVLLSTCMTQVLANLSPAGVSMWGIDSDSSFTSGLRFLADPTGPWRAQVWWTRAAGTMVNAPASASSLPSARLYIWAMAQLILVSLLFLLLALLWAGAKTRRSWQEQPPSAQQIWFEQTFLTPVLWLHFFKRWMRRKLERNPIGWLEQRTWTGRLVTWGWFAVVISLYSAIFTDRNFFRGSNESQRLLAWLLTGSIAASAAASFRRERETGVLELLLVSPLAENQIIAGRLRGLWGQFFPACGTLLAIWAYFSFLLPARNATYSVSFYAITFFTLPVVGLYFSLRCRSFIAAFSWTLATGLLLPMALPMVFRFAQFYFELGAISSINETAGTQASFLQGMIAGVCWLSLHHRLKSRSFPLQRTDV
jgi:hypothetical protein